MQEGGTPDGTAEPENPLGGFQLPHLEVRNEVGRGGFAVVYEAHQTALNRTVAVKILGAQVRDDRVRLRFERECVAMGRLSDHPHIVTVFDAGFGPAGQPYILMDFMPGGTLAGRVARGPMDWREAVATGVKLAAALEMAHRAGVLHRDIKPENVLLSAYGEPELGDFGIARLQGGPETRTGTLTASIAHAAPELLAGEPPSVQTDLYALGSTLFVVLSGTSAFVRDTDESVLPALARIASEPVPDLRGYGVPDAVAAVVERLMAKDPAERFTSALELARHLQGLQRQLGLPATPIHVADGAGEDVGATGGLPGTGPLGGDTGTGTGPQADAAARPAALDQTGTVGPPPSPVQEPTPGQVTGEGLPLTPPAVPGTGTGPTEEPGTDTGPAAPPGTNTGGAEPPRHDTGPADTPDPMDPSTIHAPPGTRPPSPAAEPAPTRRRRLPLVLGGVAVLAAVVVGAALLLGRGSPSPQDQTGTTSPTPAPAETEPPDPEPGEPDPADGEGAVLDMSREIGRIAEVRGLAVEGELDVRRYTRAAYAPLIREFAGGPHRGALEEEGHLMSALRLVPADDDYPARVQAAWEEQLPAFYDPSTGRVHVRSDSPELSAVTAAALLDEIALALLDETYDMGAMIDAADGFDAARAVSALFVGDAQVAGTATRERFLTQSDLDTIAREQELRSDTRFQAAPQVARGDLNFPLFQGHDFVKAVLLAGAGGADVADIDPDEVAALDALEAPGAIDALAAVYADPPTSTTQVIHPQHYLQRQDPIAVPVTSDPGPDWEPLQTRTFGEHDLLQLLAVFPPEFADPAAAGWRGGQLRAWTRGEDSVVAVWLEFDEAADADAPCEAAFAVRTWYVEAVGGEEVASNRFATDEDGLAVGCEGPVARFAIAPDAELAHDLLFPG